MNKFSKKFNEQNPDLAQFFFEAKEENEPSSLLDSFNEAQNSDFPYELKEIIDEGGMKRIYRAHELATQREVALALINKEEISDNTILHK